MSASKDFNQQQYANNYHQYLESNLEGNIGGGTPAGRVDLLKKYLPVGRTVLEIGSGGGIDAFLLQEAGYKVIASDYVEEFVNVIKEKGLDSILFDAKSDRLPSSVDCIYANAVFVHFSPEETSNFLTRMKEQLTNERLIFISIIKGKGYEKSARSRGFEREFYYYTPESLKNIFDDIGYNIVYLNADDDKWIQTVIAVK
jgi:cyclopropane fatty-acyl-phospholipid synthase-like methyltransferase